jgi:hypothetical protein
MYILIGRTLHIYLNRTVPVEASLMVYLMHCNVYELAYDSIHRSLENIICITGFFYCQGQLFGSQIEIGWDV